ncbi:MAG: TIGR00269 family protein [Methanomicrobiales archaeon]|nr:TIGR00269 family protein [Methanomicrobiales archaeon]MDI6876159.1 TIGR00269 family protein [Methanomicrobiales archaeon]
MKCDRDSRDAVVFQPYSGQHLCEMHFEADFESRAKREIRRHRWIAPGDRIAVGLSGGKDSSALLYFLNKLLSERRDVSLFAVTVDEGICSYRDPACARRIAESLSVEWTCISFREEFGTTLDEIVRTRGAERACSYCGVLRRRSLNTAAKEHGATKLAVGFNLDDEAQTVLMNVLRGDAGRLTRAEQPHPEFVPRIKPFRAIPEKEVALYALLHLEGYDMRRCPYAESGLRTEIREMLNAFTYRHPSTKHSLLRLGDELRRGEREAEAIRICERCGEPCGIVCRACRILDEVRRSA